VLLNFYFSLLVAIVPYDMATYLWHALNNFIILSLVDGPLWLRDIITHLKLLVIKVVIFICIPLLLFFLCLWFILILLDFFVNFFECCSIINPLLLKNAHLISFLKKWFGHLILQLVFKILFVFSWSIFHLSLDFLECGHSIWLKFLTHQILEIFHWNFLMLLRSLSFFG
jgi:hypothetical protein